MLTKNRRNTEKKMVLKGLFLSLSKGSYRSTLFILIKSGFISSKNCENSPERAVLLAKSHQFEGVLLWSQ